MKQRKTSRKFVALGGLSTLLVLSVTLYAYFGKAEESTKDNQSYADVKQSERSLIKLTENKEKKGNIKRAQPAEEESNLPAFVLSYSTKDTFDQFIFERTSENPQSVKDAYSVHAKATFTLESFGIAEDLFSRYVDYKVALSSIELDVDLTNHNLRDISYKLDERESIRRTFFNSNEYHYLFSQEAQIDEAALARLAVAQERTLSRDTRKALIVESINAGSQAEREAFQPTLNMHRINEIKQTHSSLNARYNAIAAEFGTKVADRFAQTWEQQAKWQQKVEDYKRFHDDLAKQALSPQAFEDALSEYQLQQFTVNEVKRLKVLMAQ
ncbi:lipase secretion chaperone [Alteromonas gracilis]|uniref:lipase secretion chaperone n=1 Tax=Alteromonas gracilis TaxID=1479524 RepID=UPI003736280C